MFDISSVASQIVVKCATVHGGFRRELGGGGVGSRLVGASLVVYLESLTDWSIPAETEKL